MKVSIGFHFVSINGDRKDGEVLNALNKLNLVVDGNQVELVDRLDSMTNQLRVWTEGTLEAFSGAADMIMAINSHGPVMFVVHGLSEQQMEAVETALRGSISELTIPDEDEVFIYIEHAEDIRKLCTALS